MADRSGSEGLNAREQMQDHRSYVVSYILLTAAVLTITLGFIASSFQVRRFSIIGPNVPAQRLRVAAGVQGQNIFTVSTGDVLRRLEEVPDVAITRVALNLPDTITIQAFRRHAVLAWSAHHILYFVDSEGRVIARAQRSRLPTVWDYSGEWIRLGQYVSPSLVLDIMYVSRSLPLAAITSYVIGQQRGIIIRSAHGWQADLGVADGRELVMRVADLHALLLTSYRQHKHLLYVDLRYHTPQATFAGS